MARQTNDLANLGDLFYNRSDEEIAENRMAEREQRQLEERQQEIEINLGAHFFTLQDKFAGNNRVNVLNQANAFVNPYTFVPLPQSKKTRFEIEPSKRTMAGVIQCTLTPKTDIFIPNTSYDKVFHKTGYDDEHKSYEFYSYEQITKTKEPNISGPKQPIIPGSEIRGMVRSVYEVLTNSCMSVLDNKPLTSRVVKAKKPGLLEYDVSSKQWKLWDAQRYKLEAELGGDGAKRYISDTNQNKMHFGDKVLFKCDENDKITEIYLTREPNNNINDYKKGYLYIGEPSESKKFESVFKKTNNSVNIDDSNVENLLDIIRDYYQNNAINKELNSGHNGYRQIKAEYFSRLQSDRCDELAQNTNKIPVWYSKIGKKYYFSPAAIGRELYHQTQHSLAKSYAPCALECIDDNVCYACSLFGMIDEKKSITSRVRFSDAQLKKDSTAEYQKVTKIKPLMGPKNSSFEFYTNTCDNLDIDKRCQARYWTADYYLKNRIRYNDTYKQFNQNQIYMNGRKFYWHNGTEGSYVDDNNTSDEFNSHIRPLKKSENNSNKFTFNVYFDNISEEELKHLVFSLNFGNNDKNNCHKMGKGKAIGLGSVKILVDDIFIRQLSVDNTNISIENVANNDFKTISQKLTENKLKCDMAAYNGIMKVTDFNAISNHSKIKFPYTHNTKTDGIHGTAIEWFMTNRSPQKPMKRDYAQVLPNINDPSQLLFAYEIHD